MIRGTRFCLALLLSASLTWAQSAAPPPIPTDHYGPPACPGSHAPAHRTSAEEARAEQQQGVVLDHALPSAEPFANFGIERYRLADYGECVGTSGCYWADLDAQYRRAELALEAEVAQHRRGEKLAIVLDIDETTLSNWCEMKREDFGYIRALYDAWTVGPESAVAIPGALRLFDKAKSAGVAVFFITGRPGKPNPAVSTKVDDQTPATARNLEAAGFQGWSALVLRNGPENGLPTIAYKSGERQRILDKGYRIILSVGDQWSDLLGTPQAEVSVKLPNPFYFLP